MPNLSQLKRQRMLDFLRKIREEHTDDESLIAINEIETELTSKKYGLVWEEHEERVDVEMQENVPVFTEVPDKEIVSDISLPYNFLLEGDNLHSLKLLEKTHKGKIDVIYIDPPYNRGKDDFIYDDNFVETEDSFKHSKWISFMNKRLQLAYSLLSDDGIIFISIDDKEQSQLKLLADSVFGDNNFVITLPRITKKSGKTTGSFSKNHDYVLVYTKMNQNIFVMEEHIDLDFKYEDGYIKERGKYKLNQTLDYDSLSYSQNLDYPLEVDGEIFYPGSDYNKYLERQNGNHKRADWAWRWGKDLFDFGYRNGFIVIKRKADGSARIYTKTYLKAKIEKNNTTREYYISYVNRTKALSSIGLTGNKFSNDNAKKDLATFGLSDKFDYSKPVELIKRLIKCHSNKSAIILDFFAGSGTTAQAVLELNIQDGGNRTFILATNNQNNICEEITYTRTRKVITEYSFSKNTDNILFEKEITIPMLKDSTSLFEEIDELKKANKDNYTSFKTEIDNGILFFIGKRKIEAQHGITANLKYYKTDFIPKTSDNLEYSVSNELLKHIAEMVQLEYAIKLDGINYILVMSDEEADSVIADKDKLNSCKALYVSAAVLLTGEQQKELSDRCIDLYVIPDYYFESELLEVGER